MDGILFVVFALFAVMIISGSRRQGRSRSKSTTPLRAPRFQFGSPFGPSCQASGQAQGSPEDGQHRKVFMDAVYLRLAERLEESTERAVLRLNWHRSWGDIAKNNACCQRSASSIPRAANSLR